MGKSTWLGIIESLAPTVASALGSPLSGVALAALGKVLGIDSATSETLADVFNKGKLTPAQIDGIKQVELEFKRHEADLAFSYEELTFKDRASARDLAIKTGAHTPAMLSWLIICIVTAGEGYILAQGVPADMDKVILGRILGTLDSALMLVLAYWFGSSSGSTAKTDTLSAIASKK